MLDDEDSTIAAGDIVTVVVKLKRQPMESIFNNEKYEPKEEEKVEEEDLKVYHDGEDNYK